MVGVSYEYSGTRVAQKVAHQNSLKPENITNYTFSSSVLEPLEGFKNGEINSKLHLMLKFIIWKFRADIKDLQ